MEQSRLLLICTLLLFFGPGTVAASTFIYSVDDGIRDISGGTSAGSDLMWGVVFETQPGASRITAIQVAWGGQIPNEPEISLFIYDDPNNDGDPNDGVLLTSVTTIANDISGNYVTVPIQPTEVSGKFFVAAFLDNSIDGSDFVVALDTSGSPSGQSWAGPTTSLQIDPANLAGLVQIGQKGFTGASEVMVRAVSEDPIAVPDLNRVGYAIYLSLLMLIGWSWLRRRG